MNPSIARRRVIALVAPLPVVLATRWYDVEVQRQMLDGAAPSFDMGLVWAQFLNVLLTMAAGLALASLAPWSRSDPVGALYLAVGAGLALLTPIFFTVAIALPPDAIMPGLEFVVWVDQGAIGSVRLLAAAMLIGGLSALLYRRLRPAAR